MSLEDVRVQWVRERALSALGLPDPAPFEELLNRGDGEEAEKLLRFLNRSDAGEEGAAAASALLLRAELRHEERDVEIGERGRLRPRVTTPLQRNPLLPDVPSLRGLTLAASLFRGTKAPAAAPTEPFKGRASK